MLHVQVESKNEKLAHDLAEDLRTVDGTNDGPSREKWAKIAKEHSKCYESRNSWADLGDVEPGRMVKQVDEQIFASDVQKNVTYGPIKSNRGWHLLKVVDRADWPTPKSDSKKNI